MIFAVQDRNIESRDKVTDSNVGVKEYKIKVVSILVEEMQLEQFKTNEEQVRGGMVGAKLFDCFRDGTRNPKRRVCLGGASISSSGGDAN